MPRAAHVVLGVERNATKDEVRAAFMAKAKRLHPDKSPHSTEATHEAFVELQASYEALTKERQGRLRFFFARASLPRFHSLFSREVLYVHQSSKER